MESAVDSVVARPRMVFVEGEEFDLRKLPEQCKISNCLRNCKDEIEDCGIVPRTLSQTVGNAVIFLKLAVFSFAACGNFILQNEIFTAWFNTTKLLGKIESNFLRMKIGMSDALQNMHIGYVHAWEGHEQLAKNCFRTASAKMQEMRGYLPGLLAEVSAILDNLNQLRDRYSLQRQDIQREFDTKVNRLKTGKRNLTQRKREEERSSRRRQQGKNDDINRLQEQSSFCKWLYGTEQAIEQLRHEREQLEAELAVNNQTYDNIINRLAAECQRNAEDDAVVKAIHAAITAVGHVRTGLLQCEVFLEKVSDQQLRTLSRSIVIQPEQPGQNIRDVITSDSFKLNMVLSYCLFMALEDVFGSCVREMHQCTSYFAREMTANPTQCEARAHLADPLWNQANNNWLNQDTVEDEGRELPYRERPNGADHQIDNQIADRPLNFNSTFNVILGIAVFLAVSYMLNYCFGLNSMSP
ncbi:uncharacterized protein LOC135486282 [Lineus longissimus]|uniref:uncharacterized protein LOC135486282 n=1 Tax=Lineus longissimus TaxID=88925 RepID=UPI002B4F165B